MIEALTLPFFQNALFVGLLASLACGIVGTYVVVKRISFISGSIAHTAFGGVGISYYLGLNPIFGAIVFGIAASTLIGTIHMKFKQREDTLIGAIWAVGMAIGILFIHLTPGYAVDLFSYLFGNILLTTRFDLAMVAGIDLILIGLTWTFFRAFQAITFDEEYAKVLNVPVFFLYLLLLGLVSATIVILIRVVGIILVVSLLTLPAATAEFFVKDLRKMMVLASILGGIATTSGIGLSYIWNLPSGPVIIFGSFLLYLFGFGYRQIVKKS